MWWFSHVLDKAHDCAHWVNFVLCKFFNVGVHCITQHQSFLIDFKYIGNKFVWLLNPLVYDVSKGCFVHQI